MREILSRIHRGLRQGGYDGASDLEAAELPIWKDRRPVEIIQRDDSRMNARHSMLDTLSHLIHKHLIWLLVGSYVAAGFYPSFGIWIRDVSFGDAAVLHARVRVCLP